MMFVRLFRRIAREFPGYERPVQLAIVGSCTLLVAGVVALLAAPRDARVPILAGIGALIAVIQAGILWAERGQVTPFTAAQRAYLAEDFSRAAAILEGERATGKAGVKALTLLGNTYRQQANLQASAAVLYEALHKAPDDHFPLYGIGRTLLAMGEYTDAYTALIKAVQSGAPPAVWVDTAEAAWWAGGADAARRALAQVPADRSTLDAPRAWLTRWLAWRLGEGEPPAAHADAAAYWAAQAARFSGTPYGAALRSLESGQSR